MQLQFFRMLQGLFAEGVAPEEFKVDDLEIAVRALIGAMRFQSLDPCLDVKPEDVPDLFVGMVTRRLARAEAA